MADGLITQVHSSEEDISLNNNHDFVRATPSSPYEQKPQDMKPVKEESGCWRLFCACVCCHKPRSSTPPPQVPPAVQTGTPNLIHSVPDPSKLENKNRKDTSPPGTLQLLPPAPVPMNRGPPPAKYLLPPLSPEMKGKVKTLVLDLDETLVHSSFKPINDADFIIPIELDGVLHKVYVRKRPGVENFLKAVGEKFEVVVFTASLAKYADPLLDILDRGNVIKIRLFREACVFHYGNYVKDLTHLGRKLEDTIIIDNSPFSYMFQPENAIPISSWFSDKNDRQLWDLIPVLDSMVHVGDVCTVLARHRNMFQQMSQQNNPHPPA
jgi:RNA polymerase II subunit A small phosphatase-like protein